MRISGNILDRLLNIYLPLFILYYILSFLIPEFKDTPNLGRLYCLLGMLCLITIVNYTHVIYYKIKILKIDNSIFIGERNIPTSDIVTIEYRSYSRTFNIITFEILQNGISEKLSVMEKPKLFGIFGPKGSLTLDRLYHYFPDLQGKEA
jgi:hypothetical protein